MAAEIKSSALMGLVVFVVVFQLIVKPSGSTVLVMGLVVLVGAFQSIVKPSNVSVLVVIVVAVAAVVFTTEPFAMLFQLKLEG